RGDGRWPCDGATHHSSSRRSHLGRGRGGQGGALLLYDRRNTMKMLIEGVDILIAEDNPNDLELALHGLKKYKLANNIHICRNGEEVLQFLFGDDAAAANPRLILLDLKMPKVDGLQVLRQIKADPRTKSI